MITKKEITEAWAWVRQNNSTIPDDVLDFMKDAALEKAERIEKLNALTSKPRILRLTLHRAAFEVMVTGEKKLEFRQPSKWIESRLFYPDGKTYRQYDLIQFTNGYGTDKPYFICKFEGVQYEYGTFRYSNGLEVDVHNDYAIRCGEIIEVGNYQLPQKALS